MTETPTTEAEAPDFRIETSLHVYLVWDVERGAWGIDSTTVDGYPLYSCSDDVEVDGDRHHPDAIREAARAVSTDFPTAEELVAMLTAAVEAAR